jgi:hypothetical protein
MICRHCGQPMLALPGGERWKTVEWYCQTHGIVESQLALTGQYVKLRKWYLAERLKQAMERDDAREETER